MDIAQRPPPTPTQTPLISNSSNIPTINSPANGVEHDDAPQLPKLPPCDQCRRRKVKCQQTKDGPCDRCVSSTLTCTREIQRKKRGPKKGSGSVIAKLRNEGEHLKAQERGLPPFDLSSLHMQLPPDRHRAYTNDSLTSSPLASPLDSPFGGYGSTLDPLNVPRSVPLGLGDEISPIASGTFSHAGMNFPSAWQIAEDQPLLQYPTNSSANGMMSVNDLAQQILAENMTADDRSFYASTNNLGSPLGRSNTIDALINSSMPYPTAPSAVSTDSPHSPRPVHTNHFKALYRSDSGPVSAEPRLQALASEVGLPGVLMSQCVRQYFRHLYPIMPILHQASFVQMLNQPHELTTQEKILVLSLCAITVTHASPPSDLTLQNKQDLGRDLLKQCLHLRHTYEWIEQAGLPTIISSFFICITYMELKQIRSHHFYLREAIGLAREMRGDSERDTNDKIEIICRQRMLALLFITERGCAILRNKPISMVHLPMVPGEYFDNADQSIVAGFTALCNLFSLLDEKFVELWYASTLEDEPVSSPLHNVAAIQHNLNNLSFNSTPLTAIQKADILITHQWLRLIFWQASMRQGLIATHGADEIFLYTYPITIAHDLCSVMRGMEYDAILVHGLGIFEKVFEVAYTLMDALTLAEIEWNTSDDLRYLFRCLSASPNSHNTYVKVLENKISTEKSTAQSPISAV